MKLSRLFQLTTIAAASMLPLASAESESSLWSRFG